MDLVDVNVFVSDDEDIVLNNRQRRPKRYFDRVNYFDEYDDQEFFSRFRLQKNTCLLLLQEIEDATKSPTNQNNPLSPANKTAIDIEILCKRVYVVSCRILLRGGLEDHIPNCLFRILLRGGLEDHTTKLYLITVE
ncbi:hypothetical protein QE152_g4954 [Popillia japonica]|uniref:Uncharacterized protein n=1 Tax=Popillia japonica TaxID=7064 RepID=A0AAW1MVS8_POPJA